MRCGRSRRNDDWLVLTISVATTFVMLLTMALD